MATAGLQYWLHNSKIPTTPTFNSCLPATTPKLQYNALGQQNPDFGGLGFCESDGSRDSDDKDYYKERVDNYTGSYNALFLLLSW